MPQGWSYSGDPSDSSEDAVHFLIGDTDPNCPLVKDAEITWALNQNGGNIYLAALEVIEAAIRRFSRTPNIKVGDVQKNGSEIVTNLRTAKRDLQNRAMAGVEPFFGGLSKSGKRDLESQPDDVQPSFRIGQDEHPGTTDPLFREKTGGVTEDF